MYSYVCVLSTEDYLDGILVLNENLKNLNSKYPLLCIVNEKIGNEVRKTLENFDIKYKEINSINYEVNGYNHYWKNTFDKLNVFSLIEYEKIVYLDSDFLILSNIDHLFLNNSFTMVSDNNDDKQYYCSACMVIKPNIDDYNGLISLCKKHEQENIQNIGDQDIINKYFKNINVLDIKYNCIRKVTNEYIEVYDYIFGKVMPKRIIKYYYVSDDPVIIHYYNKPKPFMINDLYNDEYCYLYMYYLNNVRKKKHTIRKEEI